MLGGNIMEKVIVRNAKGFFIGDPCYGIKKELDEMYINESLYGGEPTEYGYGSNYSQEHFTLFSVDGYIMATICTGYDGSVYDNNTDFEYFMDSATIGIMPIEMIDKVRLYETMQYEKSNNTLVGCEIVADNEVEIEQLESIVKTDEEGFEWTSKRVRLTLRPSGRVIELEY